MKPELTRKLVGLTAVLLGICWIIQILFPVSAWISPEEATENANLGVKIVTSLAGFMLAAAPAALLISCGFKLFQEMCQSSLRWSIGITAIMLALFLSSSLSLAFKTTLHDPLLESVTVFLGSVIAIFVYLSALRLLLKHLTGSCPPALSLLNRVVLIVMAWLLWALLSDVFQEYTTPGHEQPWAILGILVPPIVAYLSYRIVLARVRNAEKIVLTDTWSQETP